MEFNSMLIEHIEKLFFIGKDWLKLDNRKIHLSISLTIETNSGEIASTTKEIELNNVEEISFIDDPEFVSVNFEKKLDVLSLILESERTTIIVPVRGQLTSKETSMLDSYNNVTENIINPFVSYVFENATVVFGLVDLSVKTYSLKISL